MAYLSYSVACELLIVWIRFINFEISKDLGNTSIPTFYNNLCEGEGGGSLRKELISHPLTFCFFKILPLFCLSGGGGGGRALKPTLQRSALTVNFPFFYENSVNVSNQ